MADNVDEILKEIKARKKAKKVVGAQPIRKKAVSAEKIPEVKLKSVSGHMDLKEVALRVEGKK